MNTHLVLGAGPVGRATARLLAERGDTVLLASRSGAGPEVAGARRVAVDATSAADLTALAEGATAVYNCVNPPDYHRWETEWPPLAAAMLTAAENSGAVLVTAANLYPYGRPEGPMREGDPDRPVEGKGRVRARMWADVKAAYDAGRVRAAEVRASDYAGAGVGEGSHLTRQVAALRKGAKTLRVVGSPDQPHSWTDVRDVARSLVAVADTPASWGRVWHAPTNPPRTQREALTDLATALGRPAPKVVGYPRAMLTALGWVAPTMREIAKMSFQFDAPFVLSSAETEETLGLRPSPWEQVVADSIGTSLGE